MKRFHILIPVLLFAALACSLVAPAMPTSTATIPPPVPPSPTSLTADEPTAAQVPGDEEATNLPPVAAPLASPQPAVAHHSPGESIVLDRIVMIDASNGWAVSGADVLFTADGAQTWREATPPEALPSGTQVQAQGAFLDSQHAWAIFSLDRQIPTSAVVWHTDDSGRTWTASAPFEHQAFGDQVWTESFALDAMHLWLLVRGVYVGAGTHYVGQLFRSADGGFTWLPSIGNENFHYNYDYTGLISVDSENGLVTWQTTGFYAPSPPEYAVTSDGGGNWEVRQLPPPADAPTSFDVFNYCEPFQPQMLSSRSIRLLVGCFDVYDPPQVFSSYLYSSEDGGSKWTSLRLPEKVLANRATLFFFEAENALLLDRDIYRSADGGQSWEYVKTVNWDGQFTFVDPQTGWAIARANDQSALVRTSNGGASWIEIKPVIAP